MRQVASSRDPSRGPRLGDAARVFARSSRAVARAARTRFGTELVKWPYRDDFDAIWAKVDRIPGWFHEGNAAAMYGVIRELRPETIVEIGSYLGRSSVFFALSLRETGIGGRLVAVDPHTGDRQQLAELATGSLPSLDLFREHCRAAGVEDLIDVRVATSLEAAEAWSGAIDLLYVDGWHSYDAVVADGKAWLPHLSPDGVVTFDDYLAYEEVRDGVHELADLGLFRVWGTVFGQAVGGVSSEPPPALRRALLVSRGGVRRALTGNVP